MKRVLALIAMYVGSACGSTMVGDAGGDGDMEADASLVGCTASDQCSSATPVCHSDGYCVQCETGADCPAATPLCSNTTCMPACAGTEVAADFVSLPSDIIWVVDQSGSMDQETSYVQQKINDFAALIDMSGIDYRVVMIADPNAGNPICVPPPLAGPSCGNNTRFRLVPTRVGSTNGPRLAVEQYARYSDFLRADATKHFVFVTDDNSAWSASMFTSSVLALPPTGMFDGFKVHGIYAFGTPGTGCDGPFGSGAAEGTVYTQLIAQTGGASGVICTGDWTQVFQDITSAVVSGAQVSCELAIPPPPMGSALDPSKVNVKYQMGGIAPGVTIPRVDSAAACGPAGGWYYDDNAAPSRILLCPTTCSEVQSDPAANIKVEFGCQTTIG